MRCCLVLLFLFFSPGAGSFRMPSVNSAGGACMLLLLLLLLLLRSMMTLLYSCATVRQLCCALGQLSVHLRRHAEHKMRCVTSNRFVIQGAKWNA